MDKEKMPKTAEEIVAYVGGPLAFIDQLISQLENVEAYEVCAELAEVRKEVENGANVLDLIDLEPVQDEDSD